VEELPDGRSQVYWFTYDASGEQAWTIGVSPTSGARMSVAQSFRPVGTRFGAAFDAAQIQSVPWGTLDLDLTSCASGGVRYASAQAGFGSGTLAASRITVPAGAVCLDTMPALPSNATWSQGTDQPQAVSESAATKLGTFAFLAGGFGDPNGFKALRPRARCMDHARADSRRAGPPLRPGARRQRVRGRRQRQRAEGEPANGWRYVAAENRWEEVPQLPAYVQAGSAALNGFGWFGNVVGGVMQFDPRTGATREIVGDGVSSRDHFAARRLPGGALDGRRAQRHAHHRLGLDLSTRPRRRGVRGRS
jgi:hypothetical protein